MFIGRDVKWAEPIWKAICPAHSAQGLNGPFQRVGPVGRPTPTWVPHITPISSLRNSESAHFAVAASLDAIARPPELRYSCFQTCRRMAALIGGRVGAINLSCHDHHRPVPSLFYRRPVKISYQLPFGRSSRSCNLLTLVACLQASKTVARHHFDNVLPSEEVLEIWRNADAVCFDVDSTVCLDEGIDELADFCGAGKAVAEWTARAMTGSVPFEEALAARLSLFNPSLSQLHQFLEKKPPRISPGIGELIEKLRLKQTDVYLISGGFHQMIEPVATHLGIQRENIFANRLLFGSSGEFLGFDTKEPTSRSGGKATAVQHIKTVHNYKTLVMVGDGATDFEAKRPGGADMFICYAGVQLRETVARKADWLVFNFEDLLTALS